MDDELIDLTNFEQVLIWTESLGVSETELRDAVRVVGASPEKIQQYFASAKPLLGA